MSNAIYIVEFGSIPVGIDMLDRMIKRASLTIAYAKPVCIGKYLIVLGGDVADVREAQAAVSEAGEKRLLKEHLLTNAHRDILAYFKRAPKTDESIEGASAVGILETVDAASGFKSLDAALKCSNVHLQQVWIGHYNGGKFSYVLTGNVEDVKMALSAGSQGLAERTLVDSRVIPSPDRKTLEHLIKVYK